MNALQRFNAAPVHFVDLGETRVAYRVLGQGPPLVFVHGWPLSGSTWAGMVDALREHHTCYVPDLPGAGRSPWNPQIGEFFAGQSALIVRFIDAMKLGSVAMIGHDSGGTVARVASAAMPGRVSALALTNTETPGHELALVRRLQQVSRLPGAAAIFRLMMRSRWYVRSRFGFGGAFADADLLDGDFAETTVRPLQRDVSGPLAALVASDLSIVHRLQELHEQIDAPLLCVWGDRDPFFPLEHARQMVDAWPGDAQLQVLPGMKLFVHEEAAQRVAALVQPFLANHARPVVPAAIPA